MKLIVYLLVVAGAHIYDEPFVTKQAACAEAEYDARARVWAVDFASGTVKAVECLPEPERPVCNEVRVSANGREIYQRSCVCGANVVIQNGEVFINGKRVK